MLDKLHEVRIIVIAESSAGMWMGETDKKTGEDYSYFEPVRYYDRRIEVTLSDYADPLTELAILQQSLMKELARIDLERQRIAEEAEQ